MLRCEGLLGYFLQKDEYYRKTGLVFTHISDMNITFTTDFEQMTYW